MPNLSNDWTLSNTRGILRVLADAISQDKVQDLVLNDFIHLAISDVAQLLNGSKFPWYGVQQVVTATANVIIISGYRIDTITKLVDATNGICIEVSPTTFEGIAKIPQLQGSICWYRFGQSIYIYVPAGLTLGILTLSFNRIPSKAIADTDPLDIPDKFAMLAINKAKVLLYEQIAKIPPEALTNSVDNSIAAIRQANMEELATVKGNVKPGK